MENSSNRPNTQVTLKMLAEHLRLAPGTISKVLNNANGSEAISQLTKKRIFTAARELHYRPNFLAQSLRTKRSFMIGVLVPEIGDPDNGQIIAGIERSLKQRGYLFLTGAHRQNAEVLESYANLFLGRGVEGVITVDADFPHSSPLPTVAISVPKDWTSESRLAASPNWGTSRWSALQTRPFLERLGETATETLLAQIEVRSEDLMQMARNPELPPPAAATYPQAITG